MLVGGREEEHVTGFDERAVVVVEAVMADPLLDPVGEAARVEAVLQLPVPVVVEVGHSEMMRPMAPRVHLTNGVLAEVERELEPDFELVASPVGADGIVAVLNVRIDDAYLEAAGPQLRIVANYAVGVNNIDLEAARRRGIVISNTPDVLTGATAEVALTLMLSLLRRVTEGDRLIRRREPWEFSLEFMLGESLAGKTVLIVGAGRIGRETARLVEAFGATGRSRRPRRRPRRAPAAGRHRLDPRAADGGDAPPHRRPPARADAADRRARSTPPAALSSTRPRWPRRFATARSPAPGSTSTSTSRR